MEEKIKIFIVDDHNIFREGLKIVINNTNTARVVAEASNGKEFLEKIETANFDVVLMDIKMPITDGIKATKLAVKRLPNIKITALTMFGDEDYLLSMIEAGAIGFILKNIKKPKLEIALKLINERKCYFSTEMLELITKRIWENNYLKPKIELSKEENEILQLITSGIPKEEIHNILNIDNKLVEANITKLMQKTNSANTVSLIINAISLKLIQFPTY